MYERITLDNLSRYDSKLKGWLGGRLAPAGSTAPMAMTDKAGAVTCWPVGGTELKPAVGFLFTEVPPASGDKGPDNPSTITGVSSITVTRCETVGVDSTDYTIPLGSTYYGGSIDLATGVMTVTHVKVVLTGAEEMSWGVTHRTATTAFSAGAPWRSYIPAPKTPSSGPVCSHFPFLYNGSSDTVHFYVFSVGGAGFWYPDPDMTEVEWKAYLAAQYSNGTPVTLCYEVDVPTTVQLTPTEILSLTQTDKYTPKLNTVYSDQQSVQVGYVKSPIREEYELQQAIVAQGGNV